MAARECSIFHGAHFDEHADCVHRYNADHIDREARDAQVVARLAVRLPQHGADIWEREDIDEGGEG